MIQPVKSTKSTWYVYWVDLEEPVPASGKDYFLPTLLIISDAAGTPLAAPEILEELDQARVENFLIRLFDRLGPPDRLAILGLAQVVFVIGYDLAFWGHALDGKLAAGILLVVGPAVWLVARRRRSHPNAR